MLMKRVIAVLVFLLGATWVVNSHAQFEKGLECFDQSDSQVQLEKCAHKFISPNEEKVDRLFSKLKEK